MFSRLAKLADDRTTTAAADLGADAVVTVSDVVLEILAHAVGVDGSTGDES